MASTSTLRPGRTEEARARSGSTASDLVHRTTVQALLIGLGTFLVYRLVGNSSSPFDHYVRLTDAFLHGHLYLEDAPSNLELARYDRDGNPCEAPATGCRGYVIDPPAPTLLILPFRLLFGAGVDPSLVSAVWSGVAIALFWIATERLHWANGHRVALTLLLAFGTNFWWAGSDGSLWAFAETSAVVFSMAALAVGAGGRHPWLAGLFLGLAGLSRLPCFLGFPFYLYLVLADDLKDRGWREILGARRVRVRALSFCAGLGAMAVTYLAYNAARYGSFADEGFDHPQYEGQPFFTEGRFDLSYVPRHLEAIFFSAPKPLDGHFPYFAPSIFGTALFFVTPAFLLVFAARRGRLEAVSAMSIALVAIPHMLHGVTGWSQFGYRYSLDYLPMLAVLTASGLGNRIGRRKWALIGLSIFLACWGPLFFFDTKFESLINHRWALPG